MLNLIFDLNRRLKKKKSSVFRMRQRTGGLDFPMQKLVYMIPVVNLRILIRTQYIDIE